MSAVAAFDVARRTEEALGTLQCVGVETAGEHAAARGGHGVVGAAEAGDGVEQNDHVTLAFHKALGFFQNHFAHLNMALRRFVEGGAHHFRVFHGTFHIRDFLGAFVHEEDDEVHVGIIGVDGVGNGLEQYGLAGSRRSHDEGALSAADGRHEVDDARRHVLGIGFHAELLIGIHGRKVVEKHQVPCVFRRFESYFVDAYQSEVAFAFLGRADLTGHAVALAQMVAAYLGGRNIHVVWAGHVAAQGGAEKSVAVGQNFEHAVAVDDAVLGGAGLKQGEYEFLLAHGAGVFKLILFRQIHEILHFAGLEFREIEDAFVKKGSGFYSFGLDGSFTFPYGHRDTTGKRRKYREERAGRARRQGKKIGGRPAERRTTGQKTIDVFPVIGKYRTQEDYFLRVLTTFMARSGPSTAKRMTASTMLGKVLFMMSRSCSPKRPSTQAMTCSRFSGLPTPTRRR